MTRKTKTQMMTIKQHQELAKECYAVSPFSKEYSNDNLLFMTNEGHILSIICELTQAIEAYKKGCFAELYHYNNDSKEYEIRSEGTVCGHLAKAAIALYSTAQDWSLSFYDIDKNDEGLNAPYAYFDLQGFGVSYMIYALISILMNERISYVRRVLYGIYYINELARHEALPLVKLMRHELQNMK